MTDPTPGMASPGSPGYGLHPPRSPPPSDQMTSPAIPISPTSPTLASSSQLHSPVSPNSHLSARAKIQRSVTFNPKKTQSPQGGSIRSPVLISTAGQQTRISPLQQQQQQTPSPSHFPIERRPSLATLRVQTADGLTPSSSSGTGGGLDLPQRPASLTALSSRRHGRAPSMALFSTSTHASQTSRGPPSSMMMRRASIGPHLMTSSSSSASSQQQLPSIPPLPLSLVRRQSIASERNQPAGGQVTVAITGEDSTALAGPASYRSSMSDENDAATFNPAFTQPTQQHHARFLSMMGDDFHSMNLASLMGDVNLLTDPSSMGASANQDVALQDVLTSGEVIDLGQEKIDAEAWRRFREEEERHVETLEQVFLFLFACAVIANLDVGVIPAIIFNVKTDLPSFSYTTLGLLGSLNFLGLMLGGLAAGPLLARFHPPRLLLFTLGLQAIFLFLLGVVSDVTFMLFCRLMIGACQAPFVVFVPVWMQFHAPTNSLYTTWTNLFHAATPIGMGMGYLIGIITCIQSSAIATVDDPSSRPWKWTFIVQSFLLLPLAIGFVLIPKRLIATKALPTPPVASYPRPSSSVSHIIDTDEELIAAKTRALKEYNHVLHYGHHPADASPTNDNTIHHSPHLSLQISASPVHGGAPSHYSLASGRTPATTRRISQLDAGERQDTDGAATLSNNSVLQVDPSPTNSLPGMDPIEVPSYAPSSSVSPPPYSAQLSTKLQTMAVKAAMEEEAQDEQNQPPLFDSLDLLSVFSPHPVVTWNWNAPNTHDSASEQSTYASPTNTVLTPTNDEQASAKLTIKQLLTTLKEQLDYLKSNYLFLCMVFSFSCLYFFLVGFWFWITSYLTTYATLQLSVIGLVCVIITFIATPIGVLLGRYGMKYIETQLDARLDHELLMAEQSRRNPNAESTHNGPIFDTVGRKSRYLSHQIFEFTLFLALLLSGLCLMIGLFSSAISSSAMFLFISLILLLSGALIPCLSWLVDGAIFTFAPSHSGQESEHLLTAALAWAQLSYNFIGYFLGPFMIGVCMDGGSRGVAAGFQLDLYWVFPFIFSLMFGLWLQSRACHRQQQLEEIERAVWMTTGGLHQHPHQQQPSYRDPYGQPITSPETVHFNTMNPAFHPQQAASSSSSPRLPTSTTFSDDEDGSNASDDLPNWSRSGSVIELTGPTAGGALSTNADSVPDATAAVAISSAAPSRVTSPQYFNRGGEYEHEEASEVSYSSPTDSPVIGLMEDDQVEEVDTTNLQ